MTCRTVRRLLPLAAGDDLRPRRARAVRAHLESCPGCRAELASTRSALAGFKAAARAAGGADWAEGEWRALVARAVAGPKDAGRSVRPAPVPRWAAASALGALLCLIVMGVLFRGPSPRPDAAAGGLVSSATGAQDRLTMTMVSPDTGLQIVWILDKNFEWKGDRQ